MFPRDLRFTGAARLREMPDESDQYLYAPPRRMWAQSFAKMEMDFL